jgi:ribonuclease P protein component
MSSNRAFSRLHKRKDILRVVSRGRRVRGQSFDVIALRESEKTLRIAVVVPLLGMSAVRRNRVKRQTKEALRTSVKLYDLQGDIIVRAKKGAYEMGYREIVDELKRTLAKLIVRKREEP